MVKLHFPLQSMRASGSIARILTFSTHRGRQYLKKNSLPSDPKTAEQLPMRLMMDFLATQWQNLTEAMRATWDDPADTWQTTNYYAYLKYNLERWSTFKGPSIVYPATEASSDYSHTLSHTTAGGCRITITSDCSLNNYTWLLTYHMQLGSNPLRTYNTVVAIVPNPQIGENITHLGPLDPGTYYFRISAWSMFGKRWNKSPSWSDTLP